MMRTLSAAAAALLLAVCATAEERILLFESEIVVSEDGALQVTETLRVRAEGRTIRHGIYRDFPTLYRTRWLTRRAVPFEVVRVLRDGRREPYHTERLTNGVRIYIGSKARTLKPGEYTYTLVYRTAKQLGFFEDHDELYWNVTGTGWTFPIDKARAIVRLPQDVPRDGITLEAYTGKRGAKGRDYRTTLDEEGRPVFETTRPLGSREGLTIVVGWPKGYVHPPPGPGALAEFAAANRDAVIGGVGVLVILAYLFFAWLSVGRDPMRGVTRPETSLPDGLSPAAARYLMRMGFDRKGFVAALVDMAVKGYLTIDEEGGTFVLRRGSEDESVLSEEEVALARALLGRRGEIRLVPKSHARIRKALKALEKRLADRYKGRSFRTNTAYIVPALILSLATLLAAGLLGGGQRGAFLFMCVWLSFWTVGVLMLVRAAAAQWRVALQARGLAKVGNLGGAVFLSLFSLPFLGGEAMGLYMLVRASSLFMVPVVLALGVINFLFLHLLKAPTVEGRLLMDRIEGFRAFLQGERRPLSAQDSAKPSQVFERYLPYALALEIESQWAQRFEEALAQKPDDREPYVPVWYRGRAWRDLGTRGLCVALGGAVAASSTAPGSSSGGGGGGSSGGGGGGGGGGGW